MGKHGPKWERRRYVGEAEVRLLWDDRKDYCGEIHVGSEKVWAFECINLGGAHAKAVDADESWDKAAVAACVFGSSVGGDGDPSRETARTIEDAILAAITGGKENGYLVRRSQNRGPNYGPYC